MEKFPSGKEGNGGDNDGDENQRNNDAAGKTARWPGD
jgi:hypothetical protein